MATIREVILPNQKREDGTWNVKIRVTHQRKVNYISTQHYVGAKQIRPDHSIKVYIMEMLTILFRAKLTQGLADFWVAANAIKAYTKIVI